jgi:hypothetical protein
MDWKEPKQNSKNFRNRLIRWTRVERQLGNEKVAISLVEPQ